MIRKFISNNQTLVFGIGLPLVMVLMLSLAAVIPSMTATPPKYDVIYASNYYENNNYGVNIYADSDRKLKISYTGNCYAATPKIYIYSPPKDQLREFPITVPRDIISPNSTNCINPSKTVPISVPGLEDITIDTSSVAPDGYSFSNGNYSTISNGLITEIFFSRSYYNYRAVLKKGNYRIRLPETEGYGSLKFIGWIVPK